MSTYLHGATATTGIPLWNCPNTEQQQQEQQPTSNTIMHKQKESKCTAFYYRLLDLKKSDYAAFVYAYMNFKMRLPDLMALFSIPVYYTDGTIAPSSHPTVTQVEDIWQNQLMPHIIDNTNQLPEQTLDDILLKLRQFHTNWLHFRLWIARRQNIKQSRECEMQTVLQHANTAILIATQILTLLNHPPPPPTPEYYETRDYANMQQTP